ncbi:MAG: mandelate racemase/muconate lactonizing enzyme family protein [Variibacter sp.]|nr:mandelate racemase/muconate lactonizing enzyme family protein [Variibacter sp.]
MKIATVETFLLEAKLSAPFANSRGFHEQRAAALVAITTDDGITGWGEAYGPARVAHAAMQMFRPLLIGADPLATDQLWQKLYHRYREQGTKGPFVSALSAIDIALWDVKGKHFGLPVHRLMGGPIRAQVPVYATGLFRSRDGDPEKYLAEEAAGYVAEGFSAVKLKIGFGFEADVKAVRAVRNAIGPEMPLMVDANAGYDALEAIRVSRAIEDYRIGWFEEPVPASDIAGYRRVKQETTIPVAGGEAEFTRFGFADILASRAFDIVQPDVCGAGGFSECKIISDMAAAFGVRCNPHTWGTAIAIAASLQWLAVVPDSPPSLNAVQPMLELDRTEHPIRDALMNDVLKPGRGTIRIPDGPGLGIEIDRAAVKRFQVG